MSLRSALVPLTFLSSIPLGSLGFLPGQWPQQHMIIRRHDRPDSLYVALGRGYESLVHINLATPTGAADGEGTLIAPRWVLTAAHVATEVRLGHRIAVGGALHAVDSIILHPDWDDGPHDIALLRLAMAVKTTAPAVLYRDTAELDRTVVLVGYGDIGDGLTGPRDNDGRVRGATNLVDEATDFWLKLVFDPPGSGRTTELEGVSGPGDSGGPAFLHGVEDEVIVGVSSAQSTRAAGGQPGRYGVTEYYTRVSRYVAWVERTIGGQ